MEGIAWDSGILVTAMTWKLVHRLGWVRVVVCGVEPVGDGMWFEAAMLT